MTTASAVRRATSVASRLDYRQFGRRIVLFAAILISGGLLIFPREPLLVVVLLGSFLLVNPLRVVRQEFALIWVLLVAIAAIVLAGGQSFQIGALVIRYANFIAGMFLLAVYIDLRPRTLAEDLRPILAFFAVQAILTPVVALIAPGLYSPIIITEIEYQTVALILNFHDFGISSEIFKRPDGFFFEPGVLQFYLNVYVFLILFVLKFRWSELVLGVVAVVSTQSTTGVLILTLLLAGAFFNRLRTAQRLEKLAVLIFVPILALPVIAYTAINLSDKLYGASRGSAWAREYDFRTGLSVIAENPLIGIGFDYQRYFDEAARVGYRETQLSMSNIIERPNSNGLLTVLYTIGIPLGLVFLFGLVRQRFFRPGLLFIALVLVSLGSEALTFTPFFLLIIMSGLLVPSAEQVAAKTRRAMQPRRPQTA